VPVAKQAFPDGLFFRVNTNFITAIFNDFKLEIASAMVLDIWNMNSKMKST